MSFVFAGIAPHSPILLPKIGKKDTLLLDKTVTGLHKLAQEIYSTQPDVLIVLSPHISYFEEVFTVHADESFNISFEEFGDHSEKSARRGAPDLAARLVENGHTHGVPVRLISQNNLDYSTAVVVEYLAKNIPHLQVLPIGFSGLTPKEHLKFGEILHETIVNQPKRVAIVASGNLSHALSDKSPVEPHTDGKKFDDTLIELLETRNTVGITNLNKNMIQNAQECAYRSILILLGVLQHMNYSFKNISYESPLGVGYLVGYFDL